AGRAVTVLPRHSVLLLLVTGTLAAGAPAFGGGEAVPSPAAQPGAPATATQPAPQVEFPKTPRELFGGLFVAVQMAALYPHSKAFPDAVPKASPESIVADFRRLQPKPPDALREFVAARFELPSEHNAAPALPAGAPITEHIDALWNILTRESATVPRWSSLL